MAFGRQVGLLLWKNFVLQKRKICVSIFEIILPVFFAALMLLLRALVSKDEVDKPTVYPRFDITDRLHTIFQNPNRSYIILYTPNNTLVNDIMIDVVNMSAAKDVFVTLESFINSSELERYYQSLEVSANVAVGVQFDNIKTEDSTIPSHIELSLRPRVLNKDDEWQTKLTFEFFQEDRPRYMLSPDYVGSGFLFFQYMINKAIIKKWDTSVDVLFNDLTVYLKRMVYPPYVLDPIIMVIQNYFSMFLMLSFILTAIQTTKGLVYEKERRLKESMKLMGLSSAAHWMSWLITSFIFLVIVTTNYVFLYCVYISHYGPVLTRSDPSVFALFLLCYGISVISFCFMISVFIQKANVGAAVSGVIFFLAYLPWFFLQPRYQDMSRVQKLGTSLDFNVCMAYALATIGLYEGTGAGAQWSNIAEPASVDDNYSLLDAILMLLADSCFYFIVTWYVDQINPGEFGVPRPWNFPFTSSYWCGTQVKTCHEEPDIKVDPIYFESEPKGLETGISIVKLTKEFKAEHGLVTAVKNLNLNFFTDQISVMLGHNGAGKTTTMSMLTGFIPPTSGTAVVNGYDIITDINHVRRSLGLCPQHDILFDSMTVLEHLQFFASLKDVPRDMVAQEALKMVEEVGLAHKIDTWSMHLSGGQKRKLSVGIALIGGSQIVILDEPTSGMDPAARRQTWDILQKNKQGRTLVLTTQFMDEADLLGDRIAIMAEGRMKCCGSSMFLKKLYGTGYHLVIVKGRRCLVHKVTTAIKKVVPTAFLESEINAELSYLLPDAQSHKFPDLFDYIDAHKQHLGIISYGTTATTMEEVFLKVGEETESTTTTISTQSSKSSKSTKSEKDRSQNKHGDKDNKDGKAEEKNGVDNPAWVADEMSPENHPSIQTGSSMLSVNYENFLAYSKFTRLCGMCIQVQQFKALLLKKAIHSRRNLPIAFAQIILPVISTILALLVDKMAPSHFNEISLKLDLHPFDSPILPYTDGVSPSERTTALAEHYRKTFSGNVDPEKVDRSKYPNMTYYFLKKIDKMGIATFNKHVVIGARFEPVNSSSLTGTVLFNGQPLHSPPIALSYFMNAIASFHAHGVQRWVTVYNNPLPKNMTAFAEISNRKASAFGFTISFNIMFGMAFLTASFVYFLIKERLVGAKHLQFVSGVGPCVFWVSNLVWDYLNYFVPCLVLLPIFLAFQTDAFVLDGRLGVVLLNLLLYGWAVLPFVYLFQYMFQNPATGMVVVIILNIFTGMTTLMLVMILKIPALKADELSNALDWLFIIVFPHYCVGKAFMDMYTNYINTKTCKKVNYKVLCQFRAMPCCRDNCGPTICIPFAEDYTDWVAPGIGRQLTYMTLQGFVYFGLLLLVEYHVPQRLCYAIRGDWDDDVEMQRCGSAEDDSDVVKEKRRINTTDLKKLLMTDSLILMDLYKRYGSFVAVNHVSVGIPQRECFGLLGQNGAGKTTTFKMLTGQIMVSGGNAYLKECDIKNTLDKVHENMGYCPQFDALIDQMTGRETLYLYSRLKGVPEKQIPDTVTALIDLMMLQRHADKKTSEYSGGNKRKLSTAISLVGDPAFILLDEPSTGMDPKARRQLWNVLSMVRACGKTLILTSHSMEECEALCTRVAIMVNGKFKCLGSPQHLKSKFGHGYTLIVRLKSKPDGQPSPTEPLVEYIRAQFPSASVFDDHQGYVHFQVPDAHVSVSRVFKVMETSKSEFGVEDYSVRQTTLEQVFLSFTREQVVPTQSKTSLKKLCPCW